MAFQIHQLLIHSFNIYCIANACQAFERCGEYRDERGAYTVEQHIVLEKKKKRYVNGLSPISVSSAMGPWRQDL